MKKVAKQGIKNLFRIFGLSVGRLPKAVQPREIPISPEAHVDEESAEMEFFIMEDDTFSTFSVNERDRMIA